jgi:4-hydroxy-tetrahydrodipicolinate synthase
MVKLALGGDFPRAAKLHRKLYPVFKTLFIEPNPVPVKFALQRAGIIASAEVRAPLCDMAEANEAVLVRSLAALGR